jgi:membrane-bound lytic murein transglycosylase B
MKLKNSYGLLTLLMSLSPTVACADSPVNYLYNPQAQKFTDYMVREHDYDRTDLQLVFGEATFKQSIIDAMNRPAEKVKAWKDYRDIFITPRRIREGVEFWRKHSGTLKNAETQYGVPSEIIVAILGVETFYGRVSGSYRVIDALSTLAFDYPARSAFFTSELEHFLLLSRDQGFNPANLTGSYAGAMGYGQFMPSSYRNYAVDYDGDGIVDIWNDPVDAIGSIANYLARHDWQQGGNIVARARVSDQYNQALTNIRIKPTSTLAELGREGFFPLVSGIDGQTPAIPMRFEGDEGEEFWLGFLNFYVITRYNTSLSYAMAVTQLSELLAEQVSHVTP